MIKTIDEEIRLKLNNNHNPGLCYNIFIQSKENTYEVRIKFMIHSQSLSSIISFSLFSSYIGFPTHI